MTMKDINQRIKCWLEPKGFKQASPKSLFVKDQGFYFIVASLTPHKALAGFFFDLAVKFLWSSHEDISYDYALGDSRVYGQEDPNPTLGGILFNSESLESELAYMMKEADKRIDAYMALADRTVLLKCLENRNDFVSVVNKGFLLGFIIKATTTSSKISRLFKTISLCPIVGGSKVPAKTHFFIIFLF